MTRHSRWHPTLPPVSTTDPAAAARRRWRRDLDGAERVHAGAAAAASRCSCTCCSDATTRRRRRGCSGGLGATDWVDGYLARRLGQVSEFGKVFDPTVDRLLFIVAITAIIIDGSAPLWFCDRACWSARSSSAARWPSPRSCTRCRGSTSPGRARLATFLLMFAFPGFMLGTSDFPGADGFVIMSWLVGIPGLVLSYYTAIAYIPLIRDGVAAGRQRRTSPETSPCTVLTSTSGTVRLHQ